MKQHQHRNHLTQSRFNGGGGSNTRAAIGKRKIMVRGDVDEAGSESCYFALLLTNCFNMFNAYSSSIYQKQFFIHLSAFQLNMPFSNGKANPLRNADIVLQSHLFSGRKQCHACSWHDRGLLIFVCLHLLPKTQIQEKLLRKVTCPLTQDFTKPAQRSGNI